MTPAGRLRGYVLPLTALLCLRLPMVAGAGPEQRAKPLAELVKEGKVIGLQLAAGDRQGITLEAHFGKTRPGGERSIAADTLFCIGSCSKPFASVCVMKLVGDGILQLDTPVDRWLPQLARLRVQEGGQAVRAPTIRELLCHRSGIFSQKERMTKQQRTLIRDFTLTLAQSVDGIAKEALVAPPGQRYAYSAAGYCVLGRVAEVAAGKDFETLLQEEICRPLGLARTTFLPAPGDKNIAIGGVREAGKITVNPQSPSCYGNKLRLKLIGGSIHSTASETARFAQMVLNRGRHGSTSVLSEQAWLEMTKRQSPGQAYGMGWTLTFSANGKTLRQLSHQGSLASNRSFLCIDLQKGCFCVVHWTVVESEDAGVQDRIHAAVADLLAAPLAPQRSGGAGRELRTFAAIAAPVGARVPLLTRKQCRPLAYAHTASGEAVAHTESIISLAGPLGFTPSR